MPLDYQNTVIYKIVSKDLNIKECYVGHTTNFNRRKSEHKGKCYDINHRCYNLKLYQFIRDNGGFENFDVIIVEKFPCNDKNEASQRERYFYEQLNSNLNSVIPFRTKDERKQIQKCYTETNKEKIAEKSKEHREKNKEDLNEKHKIYRQNNKASIAVRDALYRQNHKKESSEYFKQHRINNKEKIKAYRETKNECACGGHYTTNHKARHLDTKLHQEYINKISSI